MGDLRPRQHCNACGTLIVDSGPWPLCKLDEDIPPGFRRTNASYGLAYQRSRSRRAVPR